MLYLILCVHWMMPSYLTPLFRILDVRSSAHSRISLASRPESGQKFRLGFAESGQTFCQGFAESGQTFCQGIWTKILTRICVGDIRPIKAKQRCE